MSKHAPNQKVGKLTEGTILDAGEACEPVHVTAGIIRENDRPTRKLVAEIQRAHGIEPTFKVHQEKKCKMTPEWIRENLIWSQFLFTKGGNWTLRDYWRAPRDPEKRYSPFELAATAFQPWDDIEWENVLCQPDGTPIARLIVIQNNAARNRWKAQKTQKRRGNMVTVDLLGTETRIDGEPGYQPLATPCRNHSEEYGQGSDYTGKMERETLPSYNRFTWRGLGPRTRMRMLCQMAWSLTAGTPVAVALLFPRPRAAALEWFEPSYHKYLKGESAYKADVPLGVSSRRASRDFDFQNPKVTCCIYRGKGNYTASDLYRFLREYNRRKADDWEGRGLVYADCPRWDIQPQGGHEDPGEAFTRWIAELMEEGIRYHPPKPPGRCPFPPRQEAPAPVPVTVLDTLGDGWENYAADCGRRREENDREPDTVFFVGDGVAPPSPPGGLD